MNTILKTLLLIGILSLCLTTTTVADIYKGKKILWVNSYHQGYAWSDGVGAGIESVFKGSGIQLDIYYMDTKRNGERKFKLEQGKKVKKLIEESKPDLVITSDDNAAKYVIQDYFLESSTPFVFCGVNSDPKEYELPKPHITGMQEVDLLHLLISQLKKYAKGTRVGVISLKVEEESTTHKMWEQMFGIRFDKHYPISTFKEWKKAFLNAQTEVDMIFMGNNVGVKNWNDKKAIEFVLKNQKIPSGTTEPWVMHYTLLGYGKVAEEQGAWAAKTALRILAGTSPEDIPIAKNKQGKLMLNVNLVKKLGLVINRAVYKRAIIFP